jgi:hypothetical protein
MIGRTNHLLYFFKLFNDILPKCEVDLPNSFYEAKKIIWDLGLDCMKIDVCVNDRMLYWKKQNYNKSNCLLCGVSRWKSSELVKGM